MLILHNGSRFLRNWRVLLKSKDILKKKIKKSDNEKYTW